MFRKHHPRSGARPGTLLIPPDAVPTRIRVVKYSRRTIVDEPARDVANLLGELSDDHVTWIDVQGFSDGTELEQIAKQFNIHPLAMEDIVNVPQRPKTESYPPQLLVITRHVSRVDGMDLRIGQLSMVIGPNFVLTFDDAYSDRLDVVRERLECPASRLRCNGADYLAYVILDTVVDEMYPVLSYFGERLEQLEQLVVERPDPKLLQQVNQIKNRLVNLRRSFWPQREAVRSLVLDETGLMSEMTRTFLRDTHDHCVQVSEVVEMYRETASGLLGLYMSAVAHRSNEVMKVLTIMSSIFVPLTFVAGIYGMNFEHMPELSFGWSYPAVWVLMLSIAVGMLLFFHRRGWIQVSRLTAAERDASAAGVETGGKRKGARASHQLRILDHDQSARATADASSVSQDPPASNDASSHSIRPRRRSAA